MLLVENGLEVGLFDKKKLNNSKTSYGHIIYTTSPYKNVTRFAFALLIFLAIIIPFVFFIIYFLNEAWSTYTLFDHFFIIGYILVLTFVEYLFLSWMIYRFLYPRFKIYENGITKFTRPVFKNREGQFIPFSDMNSFTLSNDKRSCSVLLTNEVNVFWISYDIKYILNIINTLMKHKIPQEQ